MIFDITLAWAAILAAAVFFYIVMDGFDLGLGILFPFIHHKSQRDTMVNSISPFWDGNETWLVLGGGGLMAAFPLAYAIIMSAFYIPVMMMLLALVFRGVSFEMRFKAKSLRTQRFWDRAFSGGSFCAAFCQGIMVGALVQGIRVEGRVYAGSWWDWLSPFSVFTGIAVVIAYGLLGACWLIWKTEGDLQGQARHLALRLAVATLLCIVIISFIMPFLSTAFRERWFTLPNFFFAIPVPIFVIVLSKKLFNALAQINAYHTLSAAIEKPVKKLWLDATPFLCALGLFFLTYTGLCISMWPMIIPPSITLAAAAASASSQQFLLVGALVLVPTILAYTMYVYWLFRGKVYPDMGYH